MFPNNGSSGLNTTGMDISLQTCDETINTILMSMIGYPFVSLSYILTNGWYLGQWGDYSSCLYDSIEGAFTLATVNGKYGGEFEFSRGGYGYYTKGFSTAMGLCYPSNCNSTEIRGYTEELITSYATSIGWTDVTISYYEATRDFNQRLSVITPGVVILGIIILVAILAFGLGTLVEVSKYGDRSEVSGPEDKNALHEASKFRRLE